jgi:hypothetical protein
MANIKRWSNVSITIESAKATAVTVDTLSKANPGVVEYTGADPTDGSFVLLSVSGMYQVDGRVFRVANVDTGTDDFELEGENTTSYDTFTSGTAAVVTFGTTLATATGLTVSGGEAQVETIYYVSENFGRDIPGPTTPITYQFECTWDPADAGLVALKAAADSQTDKCAKIQFADGAVVVFLGRVSATLLPGGTAPGVVTTQVTLSMNGRPTVYAA